MKLKTNFEKILIKESAKTEPRVTKFELVYNINQCLYWTDAIMMLKKKTYYEYNYAKDYEGKVYPISEKDGKLYIEELGIIIPNFESVLKIENYSYFNMIMKGKSHNNIKISLLIGNLAREKGIFLDYKRIEFMFSLIKENTFDIYVANEKQPVIFTTMRDNFDNLFAIMPLRRF